jgi:uncharacterized protein YhjY with autotransporter beta-barrel domain
MVLPSFVHADVTISGGTESSYVDLEGINDGSVPPGTFTTQSGTTLNAYVTGSGGVTTSDEVALWANANGWSINISNGGNINASNGVGVYFGDVSTNFYSGTLTNSGDIYGYNNGVVMGSGTITNSGTIESDYNGVYMYGGGTDTATVINSGTIQGFNYTGLWIGNVGTATVTNSGTIQSQWDNGLYIENAGTVNVTNSGTIQSGDDSDYSSAIYIENAGTVNVTNSGIINSYGAGMDISYVDDVTVTNSASGVIQASDDDGIDIYGVYRATVNNHGSIYSNGDGIYIGYTDTVTVNNAGKIQSKGTGIYIDNTQKTTGSLGLAEDDYVPSYITKVNNSGVIDAGNKGVFIKTNNEGDQVSVTNSGTITAYNEGVRIKLNGETQTAEVINTNTGTINSTGTNSQSRGVDLDTGDSSNTGTITNSGIIKADGFIDVPGDCGGYGSNACSGVKLAGDGSKTVINNAGGLISGTTGIFSNYQGNATIVNYGTIESTTLCDGVPCGWAMYLGGGNNQVTLGTGSVVNGWIVADGSYVNNNITLEALKASDVNTMDAYKMFGFSSMNKTGAGTWILTGDAYYPYSSSTGHEITVEEGVLAFAERDKFEFGFDGVETNYFTQKPGASLGIAVIPSADVIAPYRSTGALTVEYADFNNGTIVILPAAGKYLMATTIYQGVLTVGSFADRDDNGLDPRWSNVTASAFLSASLVREGGPSALPFIKGEGNVYDGGTYDLYLTRLSFTTGATGSSMGLANFLDGEYLNATGDLREIMDELMTVPAGAGGRALSELGGGTHTALQLMSFNGLGKYLGVLNNHMGGGGGFASNNPRTGMAWYDNGYLQGAQLAMAGGGNSMNDAAPMLLAALGNLGTGQIASGTKWGLWLDGYYSMGNRSGHDDAISRYKQTLFGGMIGFDYRATDNLLFGVSAGLSDTDLKFDELMDNGSMRSTHGSVYACYDGKPWYAAGVLTYAYNDYNMDRFITTLGPQQIASSDYAGREFMGYAEIGYKLNVGPAVIRPLAAFQMDYLTQDQFTEHGAGIYDLYVDKNNSRSNQSFLGVNVSSAIKLGSSASLSPELRLKWAHEFSNDEHLINARFSGMGSGSWVVKTEALSADTAIIGLGLNLMFKKNLSAYIQYDAELNRDFVNHTGLLGLRFNW